MLLSPAESPRRGGCRSVVCCSLATCCHMHALLTPKLDLDGALWANARVCCPGFGRKQKHPRRRSPLVGALPKLDRMGARKRQCELAISITLNSATGGWSERHAVHDDARVIAAAARRDDDRAASNAQPHALKAQQRPLLLAVIVTAPIQAVQLEAVARGGVLEAGKGLRTAQRRCDVRDWRWWRWWWWLWQRWRRRGVDCDVAAALEQLAQQARERAERRCRVWGGARAIFG